MSYRSEKLKGYTAGATQSSTGFADNKSEDELSLLFKDILQKGVHGFCFSLYEEGQKPGDIVSEDQIRKRMQILKPHTSWIRTFSCTDGNEIIPKIAKEQGMKTLVGAWIGSDFEKNNEELENLIQLSNDGYVDVAAVGNEVLYRNDLNEEQLLEYITQTKKRIPHVPVGYVDAYYEFVQRPRISDSCDIILCNCYPYWEGTNFEHSFAHMKHMYELALQAGNGKRIMVTETGWPSQGEGLREALPSHLNALKYFINTQIWAKEEKIELFYFSSFDESWKVGTEGDVGAYWGIWDKDGRLKF